MLHHSPFVGQVRGISENGRGILPVNLDPACAWSNKHTHVYIIYIYNHLNIYIYHKSFYHLLIYTW